jgi:signal peptidase II
MKQRFPYALIVAAVVALDQITKSLVAQLMVLHESRVVVDGLLSLTYVRNRGAAFGIFSDADLPYQSALFSAVSLLALAAIAVYALRLPSAERLSQIALSLVMGGALGNLVDRALHGYVIDFVDVYWNHHHWPAFNVADSCISIGVCLLVLDILKSPADARKPEMAEAKAPAGPSE